MTRLPSRLSSSSSLHTLILNGLGFGGEIPDSFASWTGLRVVDLSRNYLSGPLPTFVLSAWKNRIPTHLASLGRLTNLNLAENDPSGSIPPELGDMTNLRIFHLHANHLSG
jgi:hypothetical protein